jgi:proteic killer suppression protein
MIRSFKGTATQDLYIERKHRDFANIAGVALRKLDQIDAAIVLMDLKDPPGNRLEALKGDRSGQHSIRINDQFRICFIWMDDGAHEVEITDYH